jgi:hypothetical protein
MVKTHPLSPSLKKSKIPPKAGRGGTKGGEFKEFVGFLWDINIKNRILA